MALSTALRKLVEQRADGHCEYCLLHQDYSIKSHHADHIIPRKHGGNDELDNLAWSCFLCNSAKGSEVAAYDLHTGQLVALYNPRTDRWTEHFEIVEGMIAGLTPMGRVTVMVLQLNRPDRVEVRKLLASADRYP